MPRHQDPKEAARIMRDAGAIPLEPYEGSQIKWKCKCKKCKEIIFPSLATVKNLGTSPCRKCATGIKDRKQRAHHWLLQGLANSYQRARGYFWSWTEWTDITNEWRKGFSL